MINSVHVYRVRPRPASRRSLEINLQRYIQLPGLGHGDPYEISQSARFPLVGFHPQGIMIIITIRAFRVLRRNTLSPASPWRSSSDRPQSAGPKSLGTVSLALRPADEGTYTASPSVSNEFGAGQSPSFSSKRRPKLPFRLSGPLLWSPEESGTYAAVIPSLDP